MECSMHMQNVYNDFLFGKIEYRIYSVYCQRVRFRISGSKTEYMHFNFSQNEKREVEVRLDGIAVPNCKQFRYLVSSQEDGMIDKDVTHSIKTGLLKQISVIGGVWSQKGNYFWQKFQNGN